MAVEPRRASSGQIREEQQDKIPHDDVSDANATVSSPTEVAPTIHPP